MALTKKVSKKRKKPIKVVFKDITERNLVLPFALLLANKFLNIIGFVGFIDRSVEWDSKHWKVSPGNLAKAVILVTFLQVRAPLYKIKEAYDGVDTEALFGEGILPEHLNDYAIARALDRISEAKPESLFSTLCLSLYSKFNIAFNRLHSDTTTLSFYGEYEESEYATEDTLKIARGYNKDHRPECKQVVVGKIVNEHGIAVAGSTMDGNTSDIEWNEKALKLVKETFGERLHEITYIADSKLITLPLFMQLMNPEDRIRFISRCPANFYKKTEGRLIQKAYQNNQWIDLGRIGTGKKACTYQIQEFTENIKGHKTRFIVVKSSAGQARFQYKIEKHLQELEKDMASLEKKVFICEEDAREEWLRFQKAHKRSFYKYEVSFNEIKTEKRQRGNPGKDPKPPKIKITWQICTKIIEEDKTVVEKFQHEEECFVLITNIGDDELQGAEILRQYKDQSIVEIQFRLLKDPAVASTIFLKTPERINALVMLLNISLLIRALVQYKIRKNVKNSEDELPRIGWGNKKLENPTVKYVIESLANAYLTRTADKTYYYDFCNEQHKLRVITVLKLLDLTVEDFLEV